LVEIELKTKILYEISEINENRPAVLRESLKEILPDYMGFRHFFRHAYGYHLRWDLAKPLFENMSDIWNDVKSDILQFIG